MNKCKCVYETTKNTKAVRLGYVMGGAIKEECDHCKQLRCNPITDHRVTFNNETPETCDVVLCDYCGSTLHAPEDDIFWETTAEHKCVKMLNTEIEILTKHCSELESEVERLKEQNKQLGDMYHKRGNDLAWVKRQAKKAEAERDEIQERAWDAGQKSGVTEEYTGTNPHKKV